MTNNQLTGERLVKILSETQATIMEHNSRCVRGSVEVDARLFESMIMELQERRKADSEPVAYTDERNLGYIDRGRETAYLWGKQNSEAGDVPLYRHAQQPVVPRVTCWSCRNQVEISAIGDCDGYCPECDAPIDLDEEPYTSEQPAPVVPDESYQQLSDLYHAQEKRLFKIAQRIKGPAFDKYSHTPLQAIDFLESVFFGDSEDDARAAMLQSKSLTSINPATALDSLSKNDESRCSNSPAKDANAVKRLTITLPDTGSKAFWSGTGKTEIFLPVTYRRWVKEAIERCCAIARIDVEVK